MTFPVQDPIWTEASDTLATYAAPDAAILAPNEFLERFPGCYPYNVSYALTVEQLDYAILHKGMLAEIEPTLLTAIVQRFLIMAENDVFAILARRPPARLTPPQVQMIEALVEQVLAQQPDTPETEASATSTAFVVTTANAPDRLARSLASLIGLHVPILVVDDGSGVEAHAQNRELCDRHHCQLLTLPTPQGLPTALNAGIGYWLANPTIQWISCCRDDVEVHPNLLNILSQIQHPGERPLLTGRDAAEHPTFGQAAIAGYQVLLKRSMPGIHLHAHRDYWSQILPIPTPPLTESEVAAGRGTEEDWWITAWSPQSVVKRGKYTICVPGLVRTVDDPVDEEVWGGIRSQESGGRSRESGIRNQESGVGSRESGVGSREAGVGRQESGVGSRESGVRSQESEPPISQAVPLTQASELKPQNLEFKPQNTHPPTPTHSPTLTGVKVLVDGYNLQLTSGTGIKTYGTSLIKALRSLGAQVDVLLSRKGSKKNEILDEVLFYDNQAYDRNLLLDAIDVSKGLIKSSLGPLYQAKRRTSTGKFVVKEGKYGADFLQYAESFNLPRCYDIANVLHKRLRFISNLYTSEKIDIWHATYPLPINIRGAKKITTVHDVIPLRLPYATLDDKESFYYKVQDALNDSAVVIAVSEHTKQDILALFDVDPERIVVTYQPIALDYEEPDSWALNKFLQRYGLEPQNYLLFVGAIEPKKNVGRLLEAYAAIDTDVPLVIVGKKGWLWEDEIGRLSYLFEGEAQKRVKLLQYVPVADLRMLYQGAYALAFPSLYEGFGLPPIEAMSFGCPVITSTASCLPEVCGSGALYVDPYNVGDIRAKIEKLLGDRQLRNQLIEIGYENANFFSMENYIQRLSEAYTKALS
jgi:glycosyltransferase involved in cell wall biosynthesis